MSDRPLLEDDRAEAEHILGEIRTMIERIRTLGTHRKHSLAITKLEEAGLWLQDRLSE